MKASLDKPSIYSSPRQEFETLDAILEAEPLFKAAEPPRATFPASGWKRDFTKVMA